MGLQNIVPLFVMIIIVTMTTKVLPLFYSKIGYFPQSKQIVFFCRNLRYNLKHKSIIVTMMIMVHLLLPLFRLDDFDHRYGFVMCAPIVNTSSDLRGITHCVFHVFNVAYIRTRSLFRYHTHNDCAIKHITKG